MALHSSGRGAARSSRIGVTLLVEHRSFITATPQALAEQEAVGRDAQSRVMMKAAPTTPLIIRESEFLLEFRMVAFDPAARHGRCGRFFSELEADRVLRQYLIGPDSPGGHSMSSQCSSRSVVRQ